MASHTLLRAANYISAPSAQKRVILLRYISKVVYSMICKYDKRASKSRRSLSASLDFQVCTKWDGVTFRLRSFHLLKYNLRNALPRSLHHIAMRNLLKKLCRAQTGGGGGRLGAQGKNRIVISATAPLTISVSEAITDQQSTTVAQLSCLWFLIKTKRPYPSQTLFAFQATQVIIFIMDTIIMCEKWSHYYSPLQIIKNRRRERQNKFLPPSLLSKHC